MRGLLLAALVGACRTAPTAAPTHDVAAAPPPRSAPVERAPPVAANEAQVVAPVVVPPGFESAPSEAPKFARLGLDLEGEYPLRATVRTVGSTFETAEGGGEIAGSGASTRFEAFVVDEGVGSSPRRVRLLCEHARHRVARFVDASDLMVTVRDESPMFARPAWPKRVHARTPTVRLQPGAPLLVVQRPAKGFAFVRFEGHDVDAVGFVPVKALDVVFTAERAAGETVPNATVVAPARLHEQPGGRVLARIGPPQPVEMLGPRKGKWRLVQWTSADLAVTGWIDKKFLRRLVTDREDELGEPVPPVSGSVGEIVLPRGTTLLGRESAEPLGIVSEQRTAACVADCTAGMPVVRIEACPTEIEVRARLGR